jgi:hypothetical protein
MSLHDRLTEDLKLAMRSRDQLRMDVIRMIKAAVLNKEVEMKRDLDDAEMSRVMSTLIKQRRESIEQFEKAKQTELAEKERQEIAIIEAYLPHPPSAQELKRLVDSAITETGARSLKEMGVVMKTVMARLADHIVDGKQVSDLVRMKAPVTLPRSLLYSTVEQTRKLSSSGSHRRTGGGHLWQSLSLTTPPTSGCCFERSSPRPAMPTW